MRKAKYYHTVLIMTLFVIAISLSAVFALAESSVSITQPESGSTVKPGYVEVWTRFAQPPGVPGGVVLTEAEASAVSSQYGVNYTPVHYRIYKGGTLIKETDVNQSWLNFTSTGSRSTEFLFDEEGTYTITASVPHTASESASVTLNVKGEYDGVDYSDESYDSQNSPIITEGAAVRCTLTPANNYMTAYKLTPAVSGRYIFFSGGYMKDICCELYEGVGNTGALSFVGYESDSDGTFKLSAELTAGTTYTMLIKGYVRKLDTIFDVGFIRKDSGAKMASASEITLTDTNTTTNYRFSVFSGSPLPDSYWVISDETVVCSNSSLTTSCGNPDTFAGYYSGSAIDLTAIKNGAAIVKLVDKNTEEVYASCKIVCKDIAEDSSEEGGSSSGESNKETNVTPGGSADNASGSSSGRNESAPSGKGAAEERGADGTAVGKGASAATAEKAITSLKNDSDPAGSRFAPLMLKSTKQTKTSIKLTWKKVKRAKKYVIYGNRCGKSYKMKKLANSTGSSRTIKKAAGKKLKKGTYYKFIVVALDSSDHVISTSKIVHVATTGKGNYTKLAINKKIKKNKITLNKGKTFKLGARASGKNVKKHTGIRYESSDAKIAKVSKTGKITARKKGTCYICAFAQNGVYKRIKVTVH